MMETDEGRVKEISLGGRKRVALDYTEEELRQVIGVGRRLAFKGKRISKALKKSWKKREKIEVKPLGLSSRIASLERRVKKLEVLLG
jgi:hypothetical protein